MIRSQKIRDSAENEDCTMGSPRCNGNPKTVCWRHSNSLSDGKGRGLKAHDIFGFYGCSDCEEWYSKSMGSEEDKQFYFHAAMKRSWLRLIEKGIVVIK